MSKFNKSYRIRTEIGKDTHLHVNLDNDYDVLEIMSLEINQENAYKLHSSNYGVIAGRVLANGAFGIPNAKVSIFINIDNVDINDTVKSVLYPYNSTTSKDKNGVRYNLLVDEQISDCHTSIGTFPEKQYLLDNDSILEIFEKYYKFTTKTNKSGDYMIFGVPTGSQTIHVDIDLSDIGILSQTPRDMIYKGYNIERFENAKKFKYDTNIDSLVQVVSQNTVTDVIPFWGDDSNTSIGITRCDINIEYKFEPTCVFIGSVVSDTSSNGISKKCIPTPGMGSMEELTTGSGTIEMIRKTPSGDVEEFQIKGNQLINGDGVWCYQIPMNLDYIKTDEFGNTVPTDDPSKGIPTRTRVRFRMSLEDFDNDNANIFRCKMLVPHNPNVYESSSACTEEVDYHFGTNTKESSYRDLFWNGVYSVKSYIPRIQKGSNWKNEKFTGIKRINYHGNNNPIPYNNIRIRIPLMYTLLCVIFKFIIMAISLINRIFFFIAGTIITLDSGSDKSSGGFLTFTGEMCDENLENLCVIPGINISDLKGKANTRIKRKRQTLLAIALMNFAKEHGKTEGLSNDISSVNNDKMYYDSKSIDNKNKNIKNIDDDGIKMIFTDDGGNKERVQINNLKVTDNVDYLIQCIEMNLAQEYKVIQFDFYNDWINGMIYIPRWMRNISKKRTFLWGAIKIGGKVKACNETFLKNRNIVQQCGLKYNLPNSNSGLTVTNNIGCTSDGKLRCHKSVEVRKTFNIFGNNKGIVRSEINMNGQYVYYFKPCEISANKNIRLFSTDIILLGTLNDCDKWGIPNNLTELYSSTYQLPPNLAMTDSDIEGDLYGSDELNKINGIIFRFNIKKEVLKDGTDFVLGNNYIKGIGLQPEDGNYTEISGIDWGYTGPLQYLSKELENNNNGFYKPGGHFLGLSCRNSETTIKSCVNLSRICELGVFMSQSHELNIPTNNPSSENAFYSYRTVPSGLISKDEISDTPYRRIFASMNSNRLKTKINPENGYPIYDFKYVNPTNFNGELETFVNSGNTYNRLVQNGVNEKVYSYIDDDYYHRGNNVVTTTTNEKQIMRTGEFKDDEYFKFRFGIDDSDMLRNDLLKRRFLITNTTNIVSMPIYDNSFYFYFGLRDGKTALDEFKRLYYANCKKINTLNKYGVETKVEEPISNEIKLIVTGETYAGIDKSNGILDFKILCDKRILKKGIQVTIFKPLIVDVTEVKQPNIITQITPIIPNENDENIKDVTQNGNGEFTEDVTQNGNNEIIKYITQNGNGEFKDKQTISVNTDSVSFSGLTKGEYTIIVKNCVENPYDILETFSVEVKEVSFSVKISGIDFYGDVSNMDKETIFKKNCSFGGYIRIDEIYYYNETGGTEQLDFINDELNVIININEIYTTDNLVENCKVIKYGYNEVNLEYDNEKPKIPVLKCNINNNLDLKVKLNSDGRLYRSGNSSSYVYTIFKIASIIIKNGQPLDFIFNGISYNNSLKGIIDEINENTVTTESYLGWWALDNSGKTNWDSFIVEESLRLKETLYLNSIDGNTGVHKIAISPIGGHLPYHEELIYNDNDINEICTAITSTTINNILSDIKTPTINYFKDGKRRKNFSYQVNDNNGFQLPEGKKFIFPVIYKPFFMEMSLWYISNETEYKINNKFVIGGVKNKKSILYGNVYNGITNNNTFNKILLNDKPIGNRIFIEQFEDDNYMSFNEETLNNEYKIENNSDIDINGGYDFSGVTINDKTGYFKYNGRKYNVNSFALNLSDYNLYENISNEITLKIGYDSENEENENGLVSIPIEGVEKNENGSVLTPSTDIDNGVRYMAQIDGSDITNVNQENVKYSSYTSGKTKNLMIYDYNIEFKNVKNDYFVKMKINDELSGKTFIVDTMTYEYPKNKNLGFNYINIYDKIFRHVIENRLIENTGYFETDADSNYTGYVNLTEAIKSMKKYNSDKNVKDINSSDFTGNSIYYVTVSSGFTESTTNENNIIKTVSVSDMIDLRYLSKFYPMNIYVYIDDQIDDSKPNGRKTILGIKGINKTEDVLFKNKEFIFYFYKKASTIGGESGEGDKYNELLKIGIKTGDSELIRDITEYRDDLLLDEIDKDINLLGPYLILEYEIIDGNDKSPFYSTNTLYKGTPHMLYYNPDYSLNIGNDDYRYYFSNSYKDNDFYYKENCVTINYAKNEVETP